jgi:endonuclease G
MLGEVALADLETFQNRQRKAWLSAAEHWASRENARQGHREKLRDDGAGAADSANRQRRMADREQALRTARRLRQLGALPFGIERQMGPTLDIGSFAPSEVARRAGRPVGRIVDSVAPGIEPSGFGTGFLVAPGLLLTNNHVFAARAETAETGVNFLYERSEAGVERGRTAVFRPDGLFLTNPDLDYTLVEVQGTATDGVSLDDLGFISLIEATPKILIGQQVNIIQYPEGRPKGYAFEDNKLLDILDAGFLHYTTDTLRGSSGSPAFNHNWELVGLHRASIPRRDAEGRVLRRDGRPWQEEDGDDRVDWVANEGVRVSFIVRDLRRQRDGVQDARQRALLDGLLAATADPTAEVIAMEAAAPSPRRELSGAATRGSEGMATFVFNISGPVTIHNHAAAVPADPPAATMTQSLAAEERAIRFDPDYSRDNRRGFSPGFLDPDNGRLKVPLPQVHGDRLGEMLLGDDGAPLVLDYHHFSLAMNRARRLQMWSAVNVNYAADAKFTGDRKSFGSDKWIPDPRIPVEAQITDPEFYKPATKIDRGHVVRRADNCWGFSDREIEFANSDTFHWTNCTPQHEAFNQSDPARNDSAYRGMKGLWGDFENHVQSELAMDDDSACILAGPVLAADDPRARDFGSGALQYPVRFWKVVVVKARGAGRSSRLRLKAFGFIFSQKDVVERFGIERFRPDRFDLYRKPLREIETATGVVFDPALHAADQAAR